MRRASFSSKAHLRVGGGTAARATPPKIHHGASPRGRRSLQEQREQQARVGRISARPEEPRVAQSYGQARRAHLRAGGGA